VEHIEAYESVVVSMANGMVAEPTKQGTPGGQVTSPVVLGSAQAEFQRRVGAEVSARQYTVAFRVVSCHVRPLIPRVAFRVIRADIPPLAGQHVRSI
jgi:hypothetical protein